MEEHNRLETGANGSGPDIASPVRGEIGPTAAHVDRPKNAWIDNAGSNPDSGGRRSGGSVNDPHGGYEHITSTWKGPDPDPVEEMVPGGQGAEPSPYTDEELASRLTSIAARQPGTGNVEMHGGGVEAGNPDLGTDPSRLPPATDPLTIESLRRDGIYETGPFPNDHSSLDDLSSKPEAVGATLAYTASQKPNLPKGRMETAEPYSIEGSGRMQEPVFKRENRLVFDEKAGNFTLREDAHSTGVTSQDKT
jgi:hypothetical protein